MSAVFDRKSNDAVTAALENKIVLRQIFCCLPLSGLKQCRLVNRTWNFEAVSFIKDFRECHARISKERPCSDLLALAQVVSGMKVVPINSLSIELDRSGHSACKLTENQANILGKLLEMLPLQHLDVSWESYFRPLTCAAITFVIDLLRRKILELSTLEFTYLPDEFLAYFGKVWAPWLPKLKFLDIGDLHTYGDQMDFFLKIINGAPNLKKIRGRCFTSGILEVIPEDKYSCLDDVWLEIGSDREVTQWSKVALAGPAMSYLYLTAPSRESERQYMRSYIYVLERIFASSCKSLLSLTMSSPIFPLDLLNFPPLINVQNIRFQTEDTTPHLLHVLRSVDYPKLLPALYKVEVDVDLEFDDDDPPVDPWENRNAAQVVQVHPSTTVKHLKVSADFNLLTFKDLSQMYPNVVHLEADLLQPANPAVSTSHIDLWAAWPYLQSVSIGECSEALGWNFDAELLGINPEELEILRQFDDASLHMMNIVPVRPSVLTLLRCKSIKFEFYSRNVQPEVDTDQVFLSKLTGILAFKKLAKQGVKIQFIMKDAQAALRLNHLSPFVSFISKF